MWKKTVIAIQLIICCLFFYTSNSFAGIERVYFDGHAQNDTNGFQFGIWVSVIDESLKHAPDFVQTIQCTAPDGTTLDLNPINDWSETDKGFYKRFSKSVFQNSQIPSGRYYLTVTDKTGRSITVDDLVKPIEMILPVITSPTDGGTVGQSTTFRWNVVPYAKHFRVLLYNQSWQEPVYWFSSNKVFVNRRSFVVPVGVLKPNTEYRVRIEARTELQDTDSRSRSEWRTFYTSSW